MYRVDLIRAITFLAITALGCHQSIPSQQHSVSTPIRYHGEEFPLSSIEIKSPPPWLISAHLKSQTLAIAMDDGKFGNVGTLEFASGGQKSFGDATTEESSRWGRGLVFSWEMSSDASTVFFLKDADNDESFNVYRVNLATHQLDKLTSSAYVAGYRLSPDLRQLVYSSRRERLEGSIVDIRLLDLKTGEDKVLFSDEELRVKFPWAEFAWSQDAKTLFVTGQYGSDRQNGTIVSFDLTIKETPKILLAENPNRLFPKLKKTSYWGDKLYFSSPETGSSSVMELDVSTGQLRKVLGLDGGEVADFGVTASSGDQPLLFAVVASIRGTKIVRVDLKSDEREAKIIADIPYSSPRLLDLSPSELLISAASAVVPSAVLKIDNSSGANSLVATVPQESLLAGIHCDSSEVFYNTFDDISYDLGGEKIRGQIYARLYTPKRVNPAFPRLAIVQSFYGGGNAYDNKIQAFCAAGITVLSPAVRGVSDLGSAFERLNDGDLGGKEIMDAQYAGRWLVNTMNFEARFVGAWGHSHGGYASQRLLTFPSESNGLVRSFEFGFGISEAGISSIRGAYELSNIKGWVAKEAGGSPDNPLDLARWEDRSPINHIAELHAPLLLVHGTADRRAPFVLDQNLFDEATAQGRGNLVELVGIEGAGHVFNKGDELAIAIRAELNFLERRFPCCAGN